MRTYECIDRAKRCHGNSVTRFGEISLIRQNYKSLWQFFEMGLSIWQNCEPTIANLAIFHCL